MIDNYNMMYDNISFLESIIRLNKGKNVKIYVTLPNKEEVFEGIIEDSSKDYIIISNPNTGEWQLILLIYLNYITFTEPINLI